MKGYTVWYKKKIEKKKEIKQDPVGIRLSQKVQTRAPPRYPPDSIDRPTKGHATTKTDRDPQGSRPQFAHQPQPRPKAKIQALASARKYCIKLQWIPCLSAELKSCSLTYSNRSLATIYSSWSPSHAKNFTSYICLKFSRHFYGFLM